MPLIESCVGKLCQFAIDTNSEEVLCESGVGNCTEARLLEAEVSKFHDNTLSDATDQINKILASIPEDEGGRQLAFLFTPGGVLLAWARHGVVSRHDDADTIASALKVKG